MFGRVVAFISVPNDILEYPIFGQHILLKHIDNLVRNKLTINSNVVFFYSAIKHRKLLYWWNTYCLCTLVYYAVKYYTIVNKATMKRSQAYSTMYPV